MTKPKIVVIGTASVSFGPGIVRDILVHPSLHGSDIVLVDIDAEALEDVLAFGQRLNQLTGANSRLSATADRRKALPGADFVVISV
ncbi:MAG: alpha-glucosidase/alpha-galactosidase, partial [Anaerolineae bacterium]|nr:alpha-glucosidase/alpha-galactosidase [Anaerolineae bacterium]